MKRRLLLLVVAGTLAMSSGLAKATPPLYDPHVLDPGVGKVIPAGSCTPENVFEAGKETGLGTRWDTSGAYSQCQRLRVVFGPIMSKPGQNDVLIQPVTFEKPLYAGYLTRFKPDLVNSDGVSPRVKDVHLHHGTWLNPGYLGVSAPGSTDPGRPYGWGPWIATGEEKTIAVWPHGYGLNILPSDQWLFLHMIHNATPQAFPLWVVYELDFIPAAAAEADSDPATPGVQPFIHNTKGVWLDDGDCSGWTSSGCKKDSFNPIFNIQRGRGTGGVCLWPRNMCAQQNTMAGTSTQQGIQAKDADGNPIPVYDEWTIPKDASGNISGTDSPTGSLVVMGGHLHFGGLNDQVSLIRDLNGDKKTTADEVKLIHVSDAWYWDRTFNPNTWKPADNWDVSKNVVGGQPTSWDMVMTGVTKDLGWSVQVKAGDKLRIEGDYDSTVASWYEQMGIVMTWLAPGDTSGLDVFDPAVSIGYGLNTRAVYPLAAAGYTLPGSDLPACTPSATLLCARGQATHARIPTSGDHWSCEQNGCPNIAQAAPSGPLMTDIQLGGFTFGPADFNAIGAGVGDMKVGKIPTVAVNKPVTFWNADTADYMWHTITRCGDPCSGTTSADYPISDGAWDDVIGTPPAGSAAQQAAWRQARIAEELAARGPDPMDFDSGQIGYGTGANDKLSWTWTPSRTGTFTFYCRIHPGMRGAVRVV